MKVILNQDLNPLGEEGDVKDVARGYYRNFLGPRGIALPYNKDTVKLFEARKAKIEARKAEKRKDAAGLKEQLEALEIKLVMPAGPNGKLYGAVTNQTVADELVKLGHAIERKRVELPMNHFKSVGKYKAVVKLYEGAQAEITVIVEAQEIKTESKPSAAPRRGRRHEEAAVTDATVTDDVPSSDTETTDTEAAADVAPVETTAVETAPEAAASAVEAAE
jgi:large subunit ribosomal protein L9